MLISRDDVRVGAILLDTDNDYSLIYGVDDTVVMMYIVRGINTGTYGQEWIETILENEFYTEIIGHVAPEEVKGIVNVMEFVDQDWTARQIHKS